MTTVERRVAPPTAFLEAARRELVDEARAGRGGRAAMERFSDRLDALVWQLFAAAPPVSGKVAILALGGYGRRHLCLYSDVDLMILFEDTIGPEEERLVGRLLTPLWDLGLNLGHQVRELKDFDHLEADNPEFLLALVDARPVAGDTSLCERFTARFHQPE